MKGIEVGAILMGLWLGFLMCGDGVSAKEPEKYVFGGSQALSGPAYSVVIDTIVKGANLAVEEINQQGGIGGKKMELIWEDNKARGPEGVAVLNKLISINHVPVATIGYTAPIMACAPIGDQKKVLLLGQGYGPALAGAGKYLFHIPANELILIRAMLDYAKKDLNVKSIGLIHVNDDMGISVKEFLTGYCQKIGIKFAGSEAFDLAAADYSVQIEKAKRWKADAVYASVHVHPALIRQSTEKGWTPLWIACPFTTYAEYLTQAGRGLNGAISSTADVSVERNPALIRVKESWERKYGKDSWPKGGVHFLGYAYDIPYLVKTLAEYGKKKGWEDYWTGEKLRQAILEIPPFEGCMGKIAFDPKTGLSYRNVQLFRAVENPAQKDTYQWSPIGFYSYDQIQKLD